MVDDHDSGEEAEAVVDRAEDAAFDAGEDRATAGPGDGRGGGDRPPGTAELDRELEAMDVDAGGAETRERAGPVPEEEPADSGTAGGEDLDPTAAGVLSFLVPGLGTLYNGQTGRGLVTLTVWVAWLVLGWGVDGFVFGIVLGVATYGLLFVLTGFVLVVAEFVAHVLAGYDAYSQAERINAGRVRR